jgi:pimeloyl-ACP methyl ester carboxylesterase
MESGFAEEVPRVDAARGLTPFNPRRPLIFLPGIGGSRLWAPGPDGVDVPIWPPVGFGPDGALKVGSLGPLASAASKRASLLFPAYYDPLVNFLTGVGYVESSSFFACPYDWTRSNRATAADLARRVEALVAERPGCDGVDAICHSMGGLVARAARTLFGAPIRRAVYLATPHHGSPKAYFMLHPRIPFTFGNLFSAAMAKGPWLWLLDVAGSAATFGRELRSVAAQLPSMYELLPDEVYLADGRAVLGVQDGIGEQPVPVTGAEATYLAGPCPLPAEQHDLVRAALGFKRALGRDLPDESLVIYSSAEETKDYIVATRPMAKLPASVGGGRAPAWGLRFKAPRDTGQRGDGTVPTFSASAGKGRAERVPGSHSAVPNIRPTFELVYDFLREGS